MVIKLLMTLCLVALASCIDDEPFPILRTLGIYPSDHITVSSRVQSADLRLFNGPHYYIPDGKCLGFLDATLLCGNEDIKGIEVRVSDPHDFARVNISKNLGRVIIQRRGSNNVYCPTVALVDVSLSCDHWKFSHSRNRARLPTLDSDSSESSNSSKSSDEDDDVEDNDDDVEEDDDDVEDEDEAAPQ